MGLQPPGGVKSLLLCVGSSPTQRTSPSVLVQSTTSVFYLVQIDLGFGKRLTVPVSPTRGAEVPPRPYGGVRSILGDMDRCGGTCEGTNEECRAISAYRGPSTGVYPRSC